VGSLLEIKLNAIPATGYQWLLKDSSKILEEIDKENLKYTKPKTTEPAVGMPVQQILLFRAIQKGQENIRLMYKRVWEENIADSCTMKVTVD
jgi:predicted secreted protein